MNLDEILRELLKRGRDKDAPYDGVYYQDTKQKIKRWALEMVGENNNDYTDSPHSTDPYYEGGNAVKEEIRQRIEESTKSIGGE